MSGTPGRLLSLLSLLQARRDWPGQLLAQRLEVSQRTVRRDVDRLRELGYPVRATMGPDGGYRLDAGSDLPPLLFDDEQAVALAVALQLAAMTGAGIADAAWRALSTVRQVMPGRLRRRIDSIQVIGMPRAAAPQIDTAVLTAVTDAALAHEQLRFDYRPAVVDFDASADEPPRRVEPHQVLNCGGRWYLLAWDLDRDDWRTFRIDRIAPRTPTGPRFAPRAVPGGDAATFVAARFRGTTDPAAGDRWPCQGTVILHRPASEVAPYLNEGTVEALGPDRCRVVVGAWSWAGLAASMARTDADIEVVEPPKLAQAFADLARRADRAATSHPQSLETDAQITVTLVEAARPHSALAGERGGRCQRDRGAGSGRRSSSRGQAHVERWVDAGEVLPAPAVLPSEVDCPTDLLDGALTAEDIADTWSDLCRPSTWPGRAAVWTRDGQLARNAADIGLPVELDI